MFYKRVLRVACLLWFMFPVLVAAQDLATITAWQVQSVPTGRERFFLDQLVREAGALKGRRPVQVVRDPIGNLALVVGSGSQPVSLHGACGIDEPTFVISARRGAYFGVRPLFFTPLTAETLQRWVGQPLEVVNARGDPYPATFAAPSVHLRRLRPGQADFWERLSEADLYLDVGPWPAGDASIEILDRVVKHRYFDTVGRYWVGEDLGPRLACYALWHLFRGFVQHRTGPTVAFVFLVQSRFGHRGLQQYWIRHRPAHLVYLRARPGATAFTGIHFGPTPKTSEWRSIRSLFEVRMAGSEENLVRELGVMTYRSPALEARIKQTPVTVLSFPVKQPYPGVDAMPAAPENPISFRNFLRRLEQWLGTVD